ncbi:MAG: ywjD [Herbinix sp.]|jgi:UV DNA damage endonuclease|nr:ywjD [Herbinix sp.]
MVIGYACLTIGVPNTSLSRCILKNATEDRIRSITLANLSALEVMIDYNTRNMIKLFRISSDIIPFGSHPMNQVNWRVDYQDILGQLGQKIVKAGIRVSMHPGQYTVLNSFDSRIVLRAIEDLEFHDHFLTSLGVDNTCKLVLHIGGVYGDKKTAIRTFINNYNQLSESIKQRLIIENDDKNYNIQEVLQISELTGAPVVFDNLHHRLNPPTLLLPDSEWIKRCNATWTNKDGRQKIHYSQQREGGVIGSHSDTIFLTPFIEYYNELSNNDVDIMLEVKDKNLSAVKCINTIFHNATAKELEVEWARYQYFVLSRSAKLYQEIHELLKDKNSSVAKEFYERIESALVLPEDQGAQINAAQQVWGYISKDSTKAEKNRFEKLMEAYIQGTGEIQTVRKHLLKCAEGRKLEYLVNSLYFYL